MDKQTDKFISLLVILAFGLATFLFLSLVALCWAALKLH